MQIDVNGAWTSTTESWKAHEVQENTESITSLNELQTFSDVSKPTKLEIEHHVASIWTCLASNLG